MTESVKREHVDDLNSGWISTKRPKIHDSSDDDSDDSDVTVEEIVNSQPSSSMEFHFPCAKDGCNDHLSEYVCVRCPKNFWYYCDDHISAEGLQFVEYARSCSADDKAKIQNLAISYNLILGMCEEHVKEARQEFCNVCKGTSIDTVAKKNCSVCKKRVCKKCLSKQLGQQSSCTGCEIVDLFKN
jgi:hypothetical protein